MESRRLDQIHSLLNSTEKKSLFATVSSIHHLTHTPIPLNADEMFKHAANMIRHAKQEVLISFYKFEKESDAGKDILDAFSMLKSRAEEQKSLVNVYVVTNTRGMLAELVYRANTDLDFSSLEDSEYFQLHFNRQVTYAMGSLHSKMIVIDGKSALLFGGDPQNANNADKHQLESSVLLHGEIVKDIRHDFIQLWQSLFSSQDQSPSIPVLHEGTSDVILTPRNEDQILKIPCLFISKLANGNPLYFTDCLSPYKIALLYAINHAHTSIKIMTANLNDPEICEAIADACARKVMVSIVTGKHHNDPTESYWGGTNLSSIAAIVKKLSFSQQAYLNIKWATNEEHRLVKAGDTHTIHTKFVCIDDELIFTGSSPLDVQAMKYSREADVIIEDKHTAMLFCAKFFNTAFQTNKDFYEDTYYKLFIEIELQLLRIEKTPTNELRIEKAEKLRRTLNDITRESRSYHDKLYLLLKNTLPILQIRTGMKPGMPTSYNAIVSFAKQYGLSDTPEISMLIGAEQPSELARFSLLRPSPQPSHPTFENKEERNTSLSSSM